MLPDRFTLEQIREREARGKSAFYAGSANTHPQGSSGMKWITAPEEDRRCLDGDVLAYGEWYNPAGHDRHMKAET